MDDRRSVTPCPDQTSRFIGRYRRDSSAPTPASVARDIAVRGLPPALGLFALTLLAGWIIMEPLGGIPGELELNRALQSTRSPGLDFAALAVSHAMGVIGAPLVAVLCAVWVWHRTRQWWVALVPLISVGLEALAYRTAAFIVARPRPVAVEQIDFGDANFSYPSGHVGATVTLGLVLMWLTWPDVGRAVRAWMVVGLVVLTVLMVLSRLYLGMHHLTDTLVGVSVGSVAALIGWRTIRRRG